MEATVQLGFEASVRAAPAERYEPFPEPQTIPRGWDLSGLRAADLAPAGPGASARGTQNESRGADPEALRDATIEIKSA
jgi:hypothetical protein